MKVKPQFYSTLVTTEYGAYWTMKNNKKKWCKS